ncbi:MAG TPA: DUF4382 domain-containing protein [Aquabacterium sp.]|uniref:DUF4382 domain-containing protein n=1 Tax=Aquabacterium sp. TaxID=1872578 RepID=UPI002E2ECA5D|nr:DUF4382 domain-containing protein [Aquabacterium sp.]HEX5355228.1 DUF4382 domain-containing protein [Aquabacterium sp.]
MTNGLVHSVARSARRWLAIALVTVLSACGGGGGTQGKGASPASGADSTHGAFTLGLSGGGYRDVSHVWVTIGSVALHPQASQAWSGSDRSWTVLRLTTPVVVDLAVVPSSTQGDVTRVLSGLSVPAGTYGQIRLFPLAHDAALDDAAAARGLSFNAQVNYTDGGGHARVVPLELPQPDQGWRLAGTYAVAAQGASYVVVQADLQHSLVRMASADGVDHFSMRPALMSYDMGTSGAIIGAIDPSLICGSGTAPAAPNCAQDIVVSAQRLSADGQRHVDVRQYRVTSTSGGFALYPLPPDTSYDVVITGRHMQTMVIRGVTVSSFSVLDTLAWTVLGASNAPIVPVITPSTSRSVTLASPVSPRGSQLFFGQSLDASSKPYQVAVANTDVLTGSLAQALDLPEGPLRVANFVESGAALSFSDVTPYEGAQAFSVQALGTAYDDVGVFSTVVPTLGTNSSITVNSPVRQASLGIGQIQVSLTGTLSASYGGASVIVSDVNGVVTSQAVSGSSMVINVPAGSQAAALGSTAIYSVALRAAGHTGTLRWVRAGTALDLRNAASASVTLALP